MRASTTLSLARKLAQASLASSSASSSSRLSLSASSIAAQGRRYRSTQHVIRPEILALTPKPSPTLVSRRADSNEAPPRRCASQSYCASSLHRDLTADGPLVAAVGDDWDAMFRLDGAALRQKGVAIGTRRYFLWAVEKYRQGLDPAQFSIRVKPPKKVRGWGPRVQNGIRVSGRKRPGEK